MEEEMEAMVSHLIDETRHVINYDVIFPSSKNVFQIEPSANNYIMPSLGLNNGWFMFSSVSSFLSSITPNDMPLSELR